MTKKWRTIGAHCTSPADFVLVNLHNCFVSFSSAQTRCAKYRSLVSIPCHLVAVWRDAWHVTGFASSTVWFCGIWRAQWKSFKLTPAFNYSQVKTWARSCGENERNSLFCHRKDFGVSVCQNFGSIMSTLESQIRLWFRVQNRLPWVPEIPRSRQPTTVAVTAVGWGEAVPNLAPSLSRSQPELLAAESEEPGTQGGSRQAV